MSNMVVTGAAGFIGSHLCEALLAADHEVIGLDNFDPFYDPQIKRNNIASFCKHPRFSLVEGDIRNVETVEHVVTDKTDVVIHLAAKAGVRPSIGRESPSSGGPPHDGPSARCQATERPPEVKREKVAAGRSERRGAKRASATIAGPLISPAGWTGGESTSV